MRGVTDERRTRTRRGTGRHTAERVDVMRTERARQLPQFLAVRVDTELRSRVLDVGELRERCAVQLRRLTRVRQGVEGISFPISPRAKGRVRQCSNVFATTF